MPKVTKRKKQLLQQLELANKIKAEKRRQSEMPQNMASAVKRTVLDAGNENIRRVLQPLNLNAEVSLQEPQLHEAETSFAATAVKQGNTDVGLTQLRNSHGDKIAKISQYEDVNEENVEIFHSIVVYVFKPLIARTQLP